MLIKELSPLWLPTIDSLANGGGRTSLNDTVVSVQNKNGRTLVLTLRTASAAEYAVTLNIPEEVFQRTIFSIITKRGITLREVGEIDLAGPGQASTTRETKTHTEPYVFTHWIPQLWARVILAHRMILSSWLKCLSKRVKRGTGASRTVQPFPPF